MAIKIFRGWNTNRARKDERFDEEQFEVDSPKWRNLHCATELSQSIHTFLTIHYSRRNNWAIWNSKCYFCTSVGANTKWSTDRHGKSLAHCHKATKSSWCNYEGCWSGELCSFPSFVSIPIFHHHEGKESFVPVSKTQLMSRSWKLLRIIWREKLDLSKAVP